jgi:hypothetical protein
VPPVETLDNDSISGESMNSPPTHQKPVVHSENTKRIINELLQAIRKCRVTDDGSYLVNDIEKYFMGHLGADISDDFERALSHFESENIIMMIADDESHRQLFLI